MPPVLAFLPALIGAAGIGLEASQDTKKAPTAAPDMNIPGSPLTTIENSPTGGSAPTGLSGSNLLSQIISGKPSAATPAATSAVTGSVGGSVGGTGAGRAVTPPASIGGGSGSDSVLPWLQSLTGAGASPGTPGAI